MRFSSSPLSFPAYRALFLAATFSNVGTFLQDLAQSWLILELTHSAVWVALSSVCFLTPIFLLTIPAGVAADRWDRRKMLIAGQAIAATLAILLSVARVTGHGGAGILLASSVGQGLATSLCNAPWASLVPELVPKRMVPEAIAMNSVSFNVARAVGPALGGYLLSYAGPEWSFFLNGLSFLAVMFVLLFQKDIAVASELPRARAAESRAIVAREGPWRATIRGLEVAFGEPKLRACLLSVMSFAVPAGATMAVLPVFVSEGLHETAARYGSILGALGLGAVIGAFMMPRLRAKMASGTFAASMMLTFALAIGVVARAQDLWVTRAAYLVAGVGWVGTFSTLMALVQIHAPPAVKSRVVAVYGVSWLGVWVVSSLLAGAAAKRFGVIYTFYGASAAGVLGAALTFTRNLPSFEAPRDSLPPLAKSPTGAREGT